MYPNSISHCFLITESHLGIKKIDFKQINKREQKTGNILKIT